MVTTTTVQILCEPPVEDDDTQPCFPVKTFEIVMTLEKSRYSVLDGKQVREPMQVTRDIAEKMFFSVVWDYQKSEELLYQRLNAFKYRGRWQGEIITLELVGPQS